MHMFQHFATSFIERGAVVRNIAQRQRAITAQIDVPDLNIRFQVYIPHNRAPLDKGRREVLKHVHRLWGFDVLLEQQNEDGSVELLERCPPRSNVL